MLKNVTLADAMRHALNKLSQAIERCSQLLFTVNKDNSMWSSNILDLAAHWRFIPHNSRNNKRTKAKRKN